MFIIIPAFPPKLAEADAAAAIMDGRGNGAR